MSLCIGLMAQLVPILLGYIYFNREGIKLLDITKGGANRALPQTATEDESIAAHS